MATDQAIVKSASGILAPFKYIALGFKESILFIIHFIRWTFLGIYYIVKLPIRLINKSKRDDSALELNVNINESGSGGASAQASNTNGPTKMGSGKDIYSQMRANQKQAKMHVKKEPVMNEKQKLKLKSERDSLLKTITDGQEKRFDKPQTFRYKALNPDGKMETSTFIGVSKLDIYTFLTGEGYQVFSIETSDLINFIYGQSKSGAYKKLSTKDLIFFITQLCTYIKSGITLTEAMRILSKQLKKNKNQYRITQSIVYYLTMGESLSTAIEKQNGAFPQLVVNMLKAAEAAGNLEETLEDLGNYYEEMNTTQKQMISAITYPAIVGCFSIAIIIFIMLAIIPKFVDIYESAGATLNPLTLFVINASTFLKNNIFLLLLVIAFAVAGLIMAYKSVKEFRRQFQVILMKLPIIGKIVIYNELTIFTKTFSSLLKNDVFITDTIEILSKITNNEVYKEIMMQTISNITHGEKISESFKNHWAVPDIAYYMIVTGENTGMLAEMMAKVSAYYQEQHKTIINSLKSLIEPLLIIFLAFIVGGVLIAVIVPMFSLYGQLS